MSREKEEKRLRGILVNQQGYLMRLENFDI